MCIRDRISSLYLSFTDYSILGSPKWVGLKNYAKMFTKDSKYLKSLKVTFFYALSLIHIYFSILQMKMKRVSSGNLEPMATDCNYQERGDEIGFLNCCFDQMLLDLRRLTEENEKKQQLLREAQIRSLEQQMNPHFLYNTLDLVYWKAKINGEKEICTITELSLIHIFWLRQKMLQNL